MNDYREKSRLKLRERRKQRLFIKVYLKRNSRKPTENWIVGTKELKRVQGIINAGYSVKKIMSVCSVQI